MVLPKKQLGQHFLTDMSVINNLLAFIDPECQQFFIEIGPGLGALTKALQPLVDYLHVIEIDHDCVTYLQDHFSDQSNIHIYHEDILNCDLNTVLGSQISARIVGNLPYNIGTEIIFYLFAYLDRISDMHFMLQQEVVDRLAAEPNSRAYGRLSVFAQYHCQIDKVFDVSPESFSPPPKVNSSVVRLIPYRALPQTAKDYVFFRKIVDAAFNQRRKTITNSLKAFCTAEKLRSLNIDPVLRAENLSIRDFVYLSNALSSDSQR